MTRDLTTTEPVNFDQWAFFATGVRKGKPITSSGTISVPSDDKHDPETIRRIGQETLKTKPQFASATWNQFFVFAPNSELPVQ
jgi:hypothetical protein